MPIGFLFAGLFLLASAGAGCGGPSEVSSSSDAGPAPVVPPDAETIVVTAKGGMPSPQGSASSCRWRDDTFTFVLPRRALTWRSCAALATDGGADRPVYDFVDGQKTLTDAEYAALMAALDALASSSEGRCMRDQPTFLLEVTTRTGTATYRDDLFECGATGATYVSGMDDLFRKLAEVAWAAR